MGYRRLQKIETGRALRALMCAFTVAFAVAALLAPDRARMLTALRRICTAPAQLTRDYFKPELGGVSGAMLNCALVGAVCCGMMFLPGAQVNGGTVLAFFLTVGFGTYGMNILNMLPLLLGAFVCARIRRVPFSKQINMAMFTTAIAPLITQLLFYYPRMGDAPAFSWTGLLLALFVGLVAGCAMPALCAHSPGLHRGFDLYNAGPAAGFLCFFLYALLYRTAGVEAPAIGADLGMGERAFVNGFCLTAFALTAACGLLLGGAKDYLVLLREIGYKADFTQKYAAGANVLHVGVYGLFIIAYYNLIGATFTGPTMGAVFCMLACCCAGATPLNVLPVMLSYGVMGLLHRLGVTAFALNAQAIVVGLCFASGLAPISGVYGPVAGAVAAMMHYALVTGLPVLHGGFNLYNGGFTAGIVCFLLVPVLEHFFPSADRRGVNRPR